MPESRKRPFSRIGGDVALDFVNTLPLGPDGPVERITSFSEAVRWAVECALVSPREARALSAFATHAAGTRALRALRGLRAQLAHTLERGGAGLTPLANAVNVALAQSPGRQILRRRGADAHFAFTRDIESPDDLTAAVAAEIARFLASPRRNKAKRCQGEACVLWFVDITRNGSRHWCRMDGCGARAKAKAYYRRNRVRRSQD